MKNLVIPLTLVSILQMASASNLQLSEPILYQEGEHWHAVVHIRWKNAWYTDKNHDAVWLFFKYVDKMEGYEHIRVMPTGHQVASVQVGVQIGVEVSEDRLGLFIFPSAGFRGNLEVSLQIMIDPQSLEQVEDTRAAKFQVYGIEMVRIPPGPFTLGDAAEESLHFGSLYTSDDEGNRKDLFHITEEDQVIPIAPREDHLFYQAPEGYEGDQSGSIPGVFPKGVQPFYIMKYELSQGQYTAFLNALSEGQSQTRANFGGKNYYANYGSIRMEGASYIADHPAVACNYLSWDDAMAYADWAGLRPMTELEFTKAARGPGQPGEKEYPWGTSDKLQIQRLHADDGTLVMHSGSDEGDLNDENKHLFGASHYWVMDLSGGLWERLITIGGPEGRAFTGSHGDGNITNYGFADVPDWPRGFDGSNGFGFRGGGFYGYGRDYHEYNPYSPVGYRRYGGWSGGNRHRAYGVRFVRSG